MTGTNHWLNHLLNAIILFIVEIELKKILNYEMYHYSNKIRKKNCKIV